MNDNYTLDLRNAEEESRRRQYTNLYREIYTSKKPRADYLPTLLSVVSLIFVCWAIYVVVSLTELV